VTQLGWIGVWLLVAAGLAILLELILMAVWGLAIESGPERSRKVWRRSAG